MMKTKFNKFERVAGVFVLAAGLGGLAATVSVAYKKGWFSPKVPVTATFESAEGIHVGTKVQMAGLRAGSVEDVELQADNSIKVSLVLLEKFFEKARQDSVIRVGRPFIIGEKIIEVTVGSVDAPSLEVGSELRVEPTVDLMDLMGSGGKIGPYLNSLSQLADNLGVLVTAFSDKKRFHSLIEVIDEINPLVKNLNSMSQNVVLLTDQLTYKRRMGRLVGTLADLTDEINHHMPAIKENGPIFAKSLAHSVDNLATLSEELKKTLPALAVVAPDLPNTAKRMIEAVNEVVITLKAMQKSWLISGKVEEVKEEEAKAEKAKRVPANE